MIKTTQTARHADGQLDLLTRLPNRQLQKLNDDNNKRSAHPKGLWVDTAITHQTITGFGGAFTEAAAINYAKLTPKQQQELIRLYFADPDDGGHGYTLGRVPINSCDFSPASYTFDDVDGDVELEHFDASVKHDVDSGIIPMIQAAQATVVKRGRGFKLNMFASPWSPPAWMKKPVELNGEMERSMLLSAKPTCLEDDMGTTWALYFSKFISAYSAHGIDMWGVTVQNEPEAAVGWEACLWTAESMAHFVKRHLGPTLARDHPGVQIIGFDHNKDHVVEWAHTLYADKEARAFFAGVGVHWYGGLNGHNLNTTHYIAPEKFILATEACNCGGVVYRSPDLPSWWSRAESIALDILEDLRFWAIGWTDWNLLLDTEGGPNHLKNLCDANIIADHNHTRGDETLIMQASYYFMGHFSRFIPPGSKRLGLANTVEVRMPALTAGDVKNGQALLWAPCTGSNIQRWAFDDTGSLSIVDTDTSPGSDGFQHGGECMDFDTKFWLPKLQTWACAHSDNQRWRVESVPGGSRIVQDASCADGGDSCKCVTAVEIGGYAVGLDAGVTVTAAQLYPCEVKGFKTQTFELLNDDKQGFPKNMPVRYGGNMCLQPQIVQVPHFDAVAFLTPSGDISLVAMNIGDTEVAFDLIDVTAEAGLFDATIPAHSIQTYTWPSTPVEPPDDESDDEAGGADQEVPHLGEADATIIETLSAAQATAAERAPASTLTSVLTAAAAADVVAARGDASVEEAAPVSSAATGSLHAWAPIVLCSAVVVALALTLASQSGGRAALAERLGLEDREGLLLQEAADDYRHYA